MLHLKKSNAKKYRVTKGIVIIMQQHFFSQQSHAKTGDKVGIPRRKSLLI